jgi:hypothetical protein
MAAAATDRSAPPDHVADLAGLLAVLDTVWGAIPAGFFDWTRPREIALGVIFLLPFPAYLLDRRSKLRAVVFLPALLLTRWLMTACGDGSCDFRMIWVNSGGLRFGWGDRLLIAACALMQWSKARRRSRTAVRADG